MEKGISSALLNILYSITCQEILFLISIFKTSWDSASPVVFLVFPRLISMGRDGYSRLYTMILQKFSASYLALPAFCRRILLHVHEPGEY